MYPPWTVCWTSAVVDVPVTALVAATAVVPVLICDHCQDAEWKLITNGKVKAVLIPGPGPDSVSKVKAVLIPGPDSVSPWP